MSETWTLGVIVDPMTGAVVRSVHEVGGTIAEAIGSLDIPLEAVSVAIDGSDISEWHEVKPKAGQMVSASAEPGFGAALAAVTAVSSFFSTSVIAGAIGKAVLGFALSFVASSLFGPRQPSFENQAQTDTRFSISGARNRISPFQAVPVPLGTHRFVPPYGAQPYTEVVGNDQYLRMLVVWGYGPIQLEDLRIGNTPITSFQDVEFEHDLTGSNSLGLFPRQASQENLSFELTQEFVSQTTPIETDEIGITITFPQGLIRFDSRGRQRPWSVGLGAAYRLVGSTAWINFVGEVVERQTSEPVRISRRVIVPRGQYEVRVRRTSALDGSDEQVIEQAIWTAMRSFQNDPPVAVEGIAKSAIRIRATGQLNGVVDEINAKISSLVPTWDGTTWSGSNVTKNHAAIFRHVLTGAANEKGLTSYKIDNDGLGAWYEECEARGYEYSNVITTQRSVRDMLEEVAAAGFASPRLSNDRWGVVVEKPRTNVVQHFTPRNSVSISGTVRFDRIPDALRVQFVNSDADYSDDERIVYDDGVTELTASRFDTYPLTGAMSPDNAYRQGRYALASARLRPESWQIEVDFEHLIAERGDLVRLTHDVILVGIASGRILEINGNEITLDEFVVMESGASYAVQVRNSAGQVLTRQVVTSSGTFKTFTLSDASGIAVGDLLAFGESGQASIDCLIRSVYPESDLAAQLELIPYQEAVYSAAESIPPYQTVVGSPVALSRSGPAAPIIDSIVSDETALPQSVTGARLPQMLISLSAGTADPNNARATPTAYFVVYWREAGTDDAFSTERLDDGSGRIRISNVQKGVSYEIKAQAFDTIGQASQQTIPPAHTVIGFAALPPDLETFRLSTTSDGTFAEWTYPNAPGDLLSFEIRHHPDQGVTDWSTMVPIPLQIDALDRSAVMPPISGSFAIKAIDTGIRYSEGALFASRADVDPSSINVIQLYEEQPAWTGARSQVETVGNILGLSQSERIGDWERLGDVAHIGASPDGGVVYNNGTYTFGETDLGAVYESRISMSADVSVSDLRSRIGLWERLGDVAKIGGSVAPEVYEVVFQYSTSTEASPNWSVWQDFIAEDVIARHIRFRVALSTDDSFVAPFLTRLTATIDMPDRTQSGGDIATGTGSKVITFDVPFRELQAVNITPQDLQAGEFTQVTAKTPQGFTVTIRDNANQPVDRTFDYQAVGYGREVA